MPWAAIPRRCSSPPAEPGGDNWAIRAALWQNRHLGRHIVTTAVEHSAVLEACRWAQQDGCEVTYLTPDAQGNLSAQAVLDAVRPDTALVSIMMVNNELGNVFPIAEIAAGPGSQNPKTLLHTDAVQGFLKVPFAARTLGADFVTISAHKIGGPKGIGALYMGPGSENPRPLLPRRRPGGRPPLRHGGHGPDRRLCQGRGAAPFRPGETLAHMAIPAGLRRGAALRHPRRSDSRRRHRPHILALSLAGWPSQNIVNDLGAQGICISAGSACHQGKPSHVVAR